MDQLVDANPASADAHLARYRYRMRFKLPSPEDDLEAALEADPDNVDALMYSAVADSNSGAGQAVAPENSSNSESILSHAMEVAPDDPHPFMALAALKEREGDRDGAIDVLNRGRESTGNQFDFDLVIADMLARAGRVEEAKKLVAELELRSPSVLAQVNATIRTGIENKLRILRARLDMAQADLESAIRELQPIALTERASRNREETPVRGQALRLLANCHTQLGQWDKANEYWEELAKAYPDNAEIVQGAVSAFLRFGSPTLAIETIDEFAQLGNLTPDLLVLRTQAHLRRSTDAERRRQELDRV